MARVPIACALNVDTADARVEEWRRFLDARVVEVERLETAARLRLEGCEETTLVAIDLARREKACCPFFEFRLLLLPDSIWLEIEAPDEAASVLDGLVNLRQSD